VESNEVRRVYLPEHPDADDSGFVAYPLIDVATEMSTLIGLQDEYDRTAARCRQTAD
jgi:flagellar basal-body rod protein FlgC